MCGIFGVAFPKGVVREEMIAMQHALRHRGPDGDGLEELDGGTLGHLRLTILDLTAAAAQPMWDSERKVCVTYNGEIYNYKSLKEECLQSGLTFRSTSDTEVIVNQYVLHGESAFARLNGMFSFCLFDRSRRLFFLVRDRVGIKPLYYAETERGLFFASELGAFVQSGVVPFEVSEEAVAAYLQMDFVPSPLCILEGVRKLPGGSLLRVSDARVELRQFAMDDAGRASASTLDEDLDEFDRRIHDTVARQMVADVPVGVFLSGGLDSSIIAKVASEVSSKRISTFSIGFEEPSFDESEYFGEVARVIGSDHHSEVLKPAAMLELLPGIAAITSEPLADGSIFPTLLLSRFTRGHVKVALSGDGADELFGGYPTYLADKVGALAAVLPRGVTRAVLDVARDVVPVRHENFSFGFKLTRFLEGLDRDPIRQGQRWLGSFAPEELTSVMVHSSNSLQQATLEKLLHQPGEEASGRSRLEKLLRTDQRFYLQDGVLVKVDRASMASSLEVRVPYLDDEIVRFARRLPDERKLYFGSGKYLLRRYAEDSSRPGTRGRVVLPPTVASRTKKGFGAPLGAWFRGELREFLTEALSSARITKMGLLNETFVSTLLAEHLEGRRDHRKKLFNLLALVLWWEWAHDSWRVTER